MVFEKRIKLILILLLVLYTLLVLAININFRLKLGRPIFGKDIYGWAVFLKYKDGGMECDDGNQCVSGLCRVVNTENENFFKGECVKYSASHSGSFYLEKGRIPTENGAPISCFDCRKQHTYRIWTALFIFPHFPVILWTVLLINWKLINKKNE